MELTWFAGSSVLLLGVGYVCARRASRSPPAVWLVICGSLFALSTRDLFRSRERGRPRSEDDDRSRERPVARADASDERPELPTVVRLLRRVGGWFG
ncbi:hypothetical protein [Halorussus amylolyticus]|uniref:hypothetical protein n=1 Tax=Halorussus amylolyticus TaxID=1126242 RepID=UPI001049491C|nr:hypothetical protein [Halorussus amylolyticus]